MGVQSELAKWHRKLNHVFFSCSKDSSYYYKSTPSTCTTKIKKQLTITHTCNVKIGNTLISQVLTYYLQGPMLVKTSNILYCNNYSKLTFSNINYLQKKFLGQFSNITQFVILYKIVTKCNCH